MVLFLFCMLSFFKQKGAADVFVGHLAEGQGLASAYFFPFDTKSHGIIVHVSLTPLRSSPSLIVNRRRSMLKILLDGTSTRAYWSPPPLAPYNYGRKAS
jgi:hypothetical protein